jgi:hypothetical protein
MVTVMPAGLSSGLQTLIDRGPEISSNSSAMLYFLSNMDGQSPGTVSHNFACTATQFGRCNASIQCTCKLTFSCCAGPSSVAADLVALGAQLRHINVTVVRLNGLDPSMQVLDALRDLIGVLYPGTVAGLGGMGFPDSAQWRQLIQGVQNAADGAGALSTLKQAVDATAATAPTPTSFVSIQAALNTMSNTHLSGMTSTVNNVQTALNAHLASNTACRCLGFAIWPITLVVWAAEHESLSIECRPFHARQWFVRRNDGALQPPGTTCTTQSTLPSPTWRQPSRA